MTNRLRVPRLSCAALCAAAALLVLPSTAHAQIRQVPTTTTSDDGGRQIVNFTIGGFVPRSFNSRPDDDVWVQELLDPNTPLLFNVRDFRSAIVGGEYLLGVTRNIEAGVGVAFYQRTVPSEYANQVHQDGSNIEQDLKLKKIPVSFTARWLPFGRTDHGIEPYVGAGIVAERWRYEERGEFLDDSNNIFSGDFLAKGTATGPTVLAGVRIPVSAFSFGGEVRWEHVQAKNLPTPDFPSDKLDLGGWIGNFTFGVRF